MIGSDLLPEGDECPKLASAAELAEWFGVSPRTIVNWANSGILPKPVRLSPRKQAWRTEEVRAALVRLEEETWAPVEGKSNGETR